MHSEERCCQWLRCGSAYFHPLESVSGRPEPTCAKEFTEVISVAQYLRMSTEHQQYSTANQSIAILKYAAEHHMDIVRTMGRVVWIYLHETGCRAYCETP